MICVSLLSGGTLERPVRQDELGSLLTTGHLKAFIATADGFKRPGFLVKLLQADALVELPDDADIPWNQVLKPPVAEDSGRPHASRNLLKCILLPANMKEFLTKHDPGIRFREGAWPNIDGSEHPHAMFEDHVHELLNHIETTFDAKTIIDFFALWRFIISSLPPDIINEVGDDGSTLLSCMIRFCKDYEHGDLMEDNSQALLLNLFREAI